MQLDLQAHKAPKELQEHKVQPELRVQLDLQVHKALKVQQALKEQ